MKIDFKLESDGMWRGYVQMLANSISCLDPEDHEWYGYPDDKLTWVPVAVNRRKELCIREAKRRVTEIPKYCFKPT